MTELDQSANTEVRQPPDNMTFNFFLHYRDNMLDERRNQHNLWQEIIRKINDNPRSTAHFDDDPHIFQKDDSRDYCIFIQCKKGTQRGFVRNYFSARGSFGKGIFDTYRFDRGNTHYGDTALAKYNSIVIEDAWTPVNSAAKIYCEENEARLRRKASIKKDLLDPDFQKTGTFKELLQDFGIKYKLREVEDVDAYFKLLDEAECDRLFFEGLMKRGDLETMKESLDEYLHNIQE